MKTIIITIGGNSGNIVLDAADEIPEDRTENLERDCKISKHTKFS